MILKGFLNFSYESFLIAISVVFLPQPEKKIQIISFFVDFYDKTIYNLYMIKNIYKLRDMVNGGIRK
jgi:hypothetical protein